MFILHNLDLTQSFVWLRNTSWRAADVSAVAAALNDSFFVQGCNGIRLHIVDLFSDELLAAGDNTLDTDSLITLLEPLISELSVSDDFTFFKRALKNVLMDLPSKSAQFTNVQMERVQARVFEAAGSPQTRDKYREDLYAAHGLFQSSTGFPLGCI